MKKVLAALGVVAVLAAGGVFFVRATSQEAAADNAAAPDSYVTLNASLDQLKEDFNAAKGKVRLVFVVGPSCGPCLRGLDDMNRVVGDMTRGDPGLEAFVLYVPTLGAIESNARHAVKLMQGTDIHHYWDPEGTSGFVLREALGINAYAWDVWLIYDGAAEWGAAGPPAPRHWEHQLGGLPADQKLNPERFAEKVAVALGERAHGG